MGQEGGHESFFFLVISQKKIKNFSTQWRLNPTPPPPSGAAMQRPLNAPQWSAPNNTASPLPSSTTNNAASLSPNTASNIQWRRFHPVAPSSSTALTQYRLHSVSPPPTSASIQCLFHPPALLPPPCNATNNAAVPPCTGSTYREGVHSNRYGFGSG
jgi:hypothetical protein